MHLPEARFAPMSVSRGRGTIERKSPTFSGGFLPNRICIGHTLRRIADQLGIARCAKSSRHNYFGDVIAIRGMWRALCLAPLTKRRPRSRRVSGTTLRFAQLAMKPGSVFGQIMNSKIYTPEELRDVANDLEVVRGALIGTAIGMEASDIESIDLPETPSLESCLNDLTMFLRYLKAALE
jgi:hypothetical protein